MTPGRVARIVGLIIAVGLFAEGFVLLREMQQAGGLFGVFAENFAYVAMGAGVIGAILSLLPWRRLALK